MTTYTRYEDDYDRDYDPSEGRTYKRGCTCHVGFNWENGPCDYCNGDYECPDGCGEMASDCRCEDKCSECGELDCESCEIEESEMETE